MSDSQRWDQAGGEGQVNEGRVAVYMRLMEAEQRIAEVLSGRGVAPERFTAALATAESGPRDEDQHDIYLAELSRYVAALGGHLELRAVFPEPEVSVLISDATAGDGQMGA